MVSSRGAVRGRAFIGCSGWLYKSWAGTFYPKSLPAAQWLPYYAQRFGTVEINNTFYRLPGALQFAAWRDATPPGFVVAVKASRYLTHLKRISQPSRPVARLFSRAFALGSRLGPVLYQLPATLQFDLPRLTEFIRVLSVEARRARGRKRTALKPGVPPLRHVIEFRHPSWYREDTFSLLGRAGIAVCLHDMPGSAIDRSPETTFVYVRFHGTAGKYAGSYSRAVLRRWANYLDDMRTAGRDVYAYFNNDLGGTAVKDAEGLIELVSD